MKKFTAILILVLSSLFAVQAFADDSIKIVIDNTEIETDVSPQIIEGRTMVPVRTIFEALGAQVDWDSETKTITGTKSGITAVMTLNSTILSINNVDTSMDSAPVIIEGRTFIPARYAAESLGCTVSWDAESKTVYITSPLYQAETSTETTTELTTEESTSETTTESTTETTTNPMYNYDEYYKPGTYHIGVDMPAGEYVVFANPEKIGYLYRYGKDGNVGTSGKRYIYSKYFSYCDIVKVEKDNYLDLSSAYAIPIDDVEALDINRNGTFKAGTHIKTGHLTFKLSPYSSVAYISVGLPDTTKTVEYLTSDEESVTINVTSGMYVRVVNCDILDEKLSKIGEFTPVTDINSTTDSQYKFDDITPSVKTTVDDYLSTLTSDLSPETLKSTKYTSTYQSKMYDTWKSLAKTSADRKYINIANDIYSCIRNYAYYTNGDPANASVVKLNGKSISGLQYRNILKAEKEYITKCVSSFKNAVSFKDAEIALRNLNYYRYDSLRLNGKAA